MVQKCRQIVNYTKEACFNDIEHHLFVYKKVWLLDCLYWVLLPNRVATGIQNHVSQMKSLYGCFYELI